MQEEALIAALRQLVALIAEESDRNPAFAERVAVALAPLVAPRRRDEASAARPAADSIDVYRELAARGPEGLRSWLRAQPAPALRGIIRQYDLDASRRSSKWNDPEKLSDLIVHYLLARLSRGGSFLTATEEPLTKDAALRRLALQMGKTVRLRPLPIRLEATGTPLKPSDDLWRVDEVLDQPPRVRLSNIHTGHFVELEDTNLREFQAPDLLVLATQLYMQGRSIRFEPIAPPVDRVHRVRPLQPPPPPYRPRKPAMAVPRTSAPTQLLDDLAAFEDRLKRDCQVDLRKGSSITRAVAGLMDLSAGLAGEALIPKDRRQTFLAGVGLADLVVKTRAVTKHPEFSKLCKHFQLLLKQGGLLQNTATEFNEDATNKVFELQTALSVLQVGTNIELEDSKNNKGVRNPDILVDLNGMRWGLACKVLNTKKTKSYYDRVEEGIKQIDKANSAQRGFVIVNLKNVLDSERLWPVPVSGPHGPVDGVWPSVDHLGALAEAQVEQFLTDCEAIFGGDTHIRGLFAQSKAVPLTLNYVNVSAPCMVNGAPTLTNLRMLVPLKLGSFDAVTWQTFQMLDRATATP
jgi:hypothetical protein